VTAAADRLDLDADDAASFPGWMSSTSATA
jgi:hypothetical protein